MEGGLKLSRKFPIIEWYLGIHINIVNYGQKKSNADINIKVNSLSCNNSLINGLMRTTEKEETIEITLESGEKKDYLFITDGGVWDNTEFIFDLLKIKIAILEINIELDNSEWHGYAFAFGSFFFLCMGEFD